LKRRSRDEKLKAEADKVIEKKKKLKLLLTWGKKIIFPNFKFV
jgi:hypothetical protein